MPKEAATLAAAARSGLSGKPTQKEWRRGKNFSSAFLSTNNIVRRGQIRLYAMGNEDNTFWSVQQLTFVSVDESSGNRGH